MLRSSSEVIELSEACDEVLTSQQGCKQLPLSQVHGAYIVTSCWIFTLTDQYGRISNHSSIQADENKARRQGRRTW